MLHIQSKIRYIVVAIIILLTYAFPVSGRQPEGLVDVKIGQGSLIQQDSSGSSFVDITLTLESAISGTAILRVYVQNELDTPLQGGWVFDQEVSVSGDTQIDLSLPLLGSGDFSIRAITYPLIFENEPPRVSRSDLKYFRIGGNEIGDAINLLEYTQLRGIEQSESSPSFGIGSQHPHGRTDKKFSAGHSSTSTDGLSLSVPMLFVGGGTSNLTLEDSKDEAMGKPEYITIKGQIKTTVNGEIVPLHFTEVQVWDQDPLKDDLLGTARTDNNGNYNIVVKNDDGPLGGGVDVYLYLHSQLPKIDLLYLVPDGEGGYVPVYYSWKSSVHDNLDDPVVTIGFSITTNQLASTIWAGANAAVWLTESTTGRNLSSVEVRYPPYGSGTHYINGIINIDPAHGDSPDTVGHEYGHAVMAQAYGSAPEGSGGAHSLCETASKGLAWSEGFATWYGVAAWNELPEMTWHIGGPSENIELWHCGALDATLDEGRTSAWLWDLYDIPQDSNNGDANYGKTGFSDNNEGAQIVGSRTLINTLWKRKQNTLTDYWTDLQTEITETEKDPSTRISNYNYLIQ